MPRALLLFLIGCVPIAAGLLDIRFPNWKPPSTLDILLGNSGFCLICVAGIYLEWYTAGAALTEGRQKIIQQLGRARTLDHGLYVISDEVYEKIVYEGEHHSIASLNGLEKRVVTVNGFSKTYAMTGWRLGYAASSEEIVSEMAKLQMYNSTCPVSFVQKAAVEALRGPQEFVKKMIEEYGRRRELIYKGLSQINGISVVKPKGAFYIFPKVSAR